MRSGWKTSSWSSFSPSEANLIGLPVTALTESAAPPRASPSSFVRMTPSKSTCSAKASATLTASWPVIESSTSRTLCGLTALRTWTSSSIISSSTCRRPAVSTMTHVAALRARLLETGLRDGDRILRAPVEIDRDLDLPAELLELVDRGRPLEVAGDERRRLVVLLAQVQRELRRRGRLSRALAGRRAGSPSAVGRRTRASSSPPHQLGQLLVDDLHDLLARRQALQHLGAERTRLARARGTP